MTNQKNSFCAFGNPDKMKNILLYLFLASGISLFTGCQFLTGEVDISDLNEWLADTDYDWNSQKSCNEIQLISQSIPPELRVWNLKQSTSDIDFEKELLQNKSVEYFTFTMKHDKFSPLQILSSSQEEYFKIQDYIENDMRFEFMMVTDKDTLFPSLYHVERYYNYIPEIKINLAFDKGTSTFKKLVFENSLLNCPFLEFHNNRQPLPKINFN